MEKTGRARLEHQIKSFGLMHGLELSTQTRQALTDEIYDNWMQVSTQVIDDLVGAGETALDAMERASSVHPNAAYELTIPMVSLRQAVARAKRYLAVPETGTRERIGISLKENPRDHFSGSRRCEHGR